MKQNKILTIIASYNGINWIDKCLDSLMNSCLSCDVICIDNLSNDNTVSFIKSKFPKVILYESDKNLGFGKANNIGFEYAIENGYDYVFLLNQDAWITHTTLSTLFSCYNKMGEEGVLSPLHLNPKGNGLDFSFEYCLRMQIKTNLISDYLLISKNQLNFFEVNFINAAAWFFSIKTLKKVGGFNPIFFQYGEDNNFSHRLKRFGLKFFVDPNSIIFHDGPKQSKRTYKGIKKNAKREYSEYLILLSNPNLNFRYSLRESFINLSNGFLRSIFPINLSSFLVYIYVSLFIFFNLFRILKFRKQSKLSGAFI